MRSLIVLALLPCVLASLDLGDWETFKGHYGKRYLSGAEESFRRDVFESNVRFIEARNRMGLGYQLGVNQFADLTKAEFDSMMLGTRVNASSVYGISSSSTPSEVSVQDLPDNVDWRTASIVTPVKDQAKCGSCWAFSTTGSVEGQHAKKTGKLEALSEQQLVDCSWLNHGCNGGQMMFAFEYVKMNGGLTTEAKYPYKAVDGSCSFKSSDAVATITGFEMVLPFSETSLQKAVAEVGPVSVAIDASGEDFRFYKSGVYNPASCGRFILDHGVLVVGYGSSKEEGEWWLVKNSWNTSWGLEGYFKLARNQGNKCGVATTASYPTV